MKLPQSIKLKMLRQEVLDVGSMKQDNWEYDAHYYGLIGHVLEALPHLYKMGNLWWYSYERWPDAIRFFEAEVDKAIARVEGFEKMRAELVKWMMAIAATAVILGGVIISASLIVLALGSTHPYIWICAPVVIGLVLLLKRSVFND